MRSKEKIDGGREGGGMGSQRSEWLKSQLIVTPERRDVRSASGVKHNEPWSMTHSQGPMPHLFFRVHQFLKYSKQRQMAAVYGSAFSDMAAQMPRFLADK